MEWSNSTVAALPGMYQVAQQTLFADAKGAHQKDTNAIQASLHVSRAHVSWPCTIPRPADMGPEREHACIKMAAGPAKRAGSALAADPAMKTMHTCTGLHRT